MSFGDVAIKSADTYLEYLTRENKGLNKTKVVSIEQKNKSMFRFELESQLAYYDALQLEISKEIYSDNKIEIVRYEKDKDKDKNILIVRPIGKEMIDILKTANADEIFVCSDMRFLVENVREWYKRFGEKIKLPIDKAFIPAVQFAADDSPSEDQKMAINMVLNEPFSYVWGAPGTGKTKYVLARCILQYIKEKKQIILLAPTNLSLEQSLYGIFDVLQKEEVDIDSNIIRLGFSTGEFFKKHPNVCEKRDIEKKFGEINNSILQKKKEIEELHNKKAKCRRQENIAKFFAENIVEIKKNMYSYFSYRYCCEKLKRKRFFKGTLISSFIENIFKNTKRREIELRNEEKMNYYLDKLSNSFCADEAASIFANLNISKCKDSDMFFMNLGMAIKKEYTDINTDDDIFLHSFWSKEIVKITDKINGFVQRANEINEEITKLENTMNIKARKNKELSHYSVIAATVDTFLARIEPEEFDISHIFLDEAAYCSMIKGSTLLGYDSPLAFFGDHMQLPPVSEMDDDKNHKEIVLWKQSAIYAEQAVTDSFEKIYEYFCEGKNAPFINMKKCDLIYTHRFGKNLVSILANEIYSKDLRSCVSERTELCYIDVINDKKEEGEKNTNSQEAKKVKEYLHYASKCLRDDSNKKIGILTPYKNQAKLLRKEISNKDSVMTIHASQGREWDTVILSLVKSRATKFITTKRLNGKQLINTAISRAKKKLIIVCDVNSWKDQKRELICKLLNEATEIKMEE